MGRRVGCGESKFKSGYGLMFEKGKKDPKQHEELGFSMFQAIPTTLLVSFEFWLIYY